MHNGRGMGSVGLKKVYIGILFYFLHRKHNYDEKEATHRTFACSPARGSAFVCVIQVIARTAESCHDLAFSSQDVNRFFDVASGNPGAIDYISANLKTPVKFISVGPSLGQRFEG